MNDSIDKYSSLLPDVPKKEAGSNWLKSLLGMNSLISVNIVNINCGNTIETQNNEIHKPEKVTKKRQKALKKPDEEAFIPIRKNKQLADKVIDIRPSDFKTVIEWKTLDKND